MNAHGSPVGSLRSMLGPDRFRAPSVNLPRASGGHPLGVRVMAGCSDEREPPTGKPWASAAADGPLQDPPYAASIFSQISTRALFCWASESESSGVAGS